VNEQCERKRMLRLLVEDVTLTREGKEIRADVRFRGGAAQTLWLPAPLSASQRTRTPTPIVAEIDRLPDQTTPAHIAELLNEQGLRSGQGKPFYPAIVQGIIRRHQLKDRYTRLRERGMLTREEVAQAAGIHPSTVASWRRAGLLQTAPYNDRNDCLYLPPRDPAPVKHKRKGIRDRLAAERRTPRRQSHSASQVRGAV
jgi:hypothetical protein